MGFDSAYTSKSAHPRPNTLSVGMVAFIAIAGLQPFAVACTPSWEALLLGICLAIALTSFRSLLKCPKRKTSPGLDPV